MASSTVAPEQPPVPPQAWGLGTQSTSSFAKRKNAGKNSMFSDKTQFDLIFVMIDFEDPRIEEGIDHLSKPHVQKSTKNWR